MRVAALAKRDTPAFAGVTVQVEATVSDVS